MSTTFVDPAVINSTCTITSTSGTAFTVAASGSNYGLHIDESTASAATGLRIKPAAAGSGLALSTISPGTNENLTIDAKGTGTVTIGGTSTGNVKLAANTAVDISGSDGSARFTSSKSTNAYLTWVFDTTNTNGGGIYVEKSGSRVLYLGTGSANLDPSIAATDGFVYADGYLYLGTGNNVIRPQVDNSESFGDGSFRWSTIYAANGTIQTSDLREKNVVGDSLGLDFIKALKPIAFRWKRDDGKVRYGLGAQDVLRAAPEGAFVHAENPECLGMNYSEFIAPLVKSVQELNTKLEAAYRYIDTLIKHVEQQRND